MSQVSLQPAARVLDNFALTETRQSGAGQELAQVADALSSLNPTLQRYAQMRANAAAEEDRRAAFEDFQKSAIENRDQFAEAVRTGQIRQTESPWYQRTYLNLVLQREFQQQKRGWMQEYQQNRDLRQSTDLTGKDLETFLRGKVRSFADGVDSWGVLAIAEDSEKFIQDTVNSHVAKRENEINNDLVNSVSKDMANAMVGVSADSLLDSNNSTNVSAIQAAAEKLWGAGYTDSQIASITLTALSNAAVDSNEPGTVDSLEAALSSVRVGDKTLKELLPAVDTAKLRDRIADRQYQRAARAVQFDELNRRQEIQRYINLAAKGGNDSIPWSEIDGVTKIELTRTLAEASAAEMRLAESSFRDNEWSGLLKQIQENGGEVPDGALVNIRHVVASKLPTALARDYMGLLRDLNHTERWADESDMESFIKLSSLVNGKAPFTEIMQSLTDAARDRKISQRDFMQLEDRARRGQTDRGRETNQILSAAIRDLDLRFEIGAPDGYNQTLDGKTAPTQMARGVQNDITSRLMSRFYDYLDSEEGKGKSAVELSKWLNDTADSMLGERGFMSRAEFMSKLPIADVLATVANTEGSFVTIPSTMHERVRFKDGRLYADDGKTSAVLSKPVLLAPPSTLPDEFETIAEKVGAKDEDSKAALLRNQFEAMKTGGFPEKDIKSVADRMKMIRENKIATPKQKLALSELEQFEQRGRWSPATAGRQPAPGGTKPTQADLESRFEEHLQLLEKAADGSRMRVLASTGTLLDSARRTKYLLEHSNTAYVEDRATGLMYFAYSDDGSWAKSVDLATARLDRITKLHMKIAAAQFQNKPAASSN